MKTSLSMLLFCRIKLLYPQLFILVDTDDSLVSYWVLFGAPAPKLTIFSPEFRLVCLLERYKMIRTNHSMLLVVVVVVYYTHTCTLGPRAYALKY